MDNTKTVISLFSGYGGLERGLVLAGEKIRVAAFCEIEAYAAANIISKMETGQMAPAPVWTDVKTLDARQFRGVVDILTGGFPCQPFSGAGKRAADDDPRHLFPDVLRCIRDARPRTVFLENVYGIVSAVLTGDGWNDPAGTPVLLHVLRELERVGYSATAGVFSSRETGGSHQRKRVFILGHATAGLHGAYNAGESQRQKPQLRNRPCAGAVGHAKHNGRYGAEESRGAAPCGHNHAEGKGAPVQPTGTGRPRELRDIPRRQLIARPGEEQYSWELPRTEPRLGGATNGAATTNNSTANRVDRIRMLGNGVDPHAAARAWKLLQIK
ncbi:MAG: DNA cytosine methyltransferase [Shimia sp.]|nr:DNA cytosine methyltransferase [Shimia sp.]